MNEQKLEDLLKQLALRTKEAPTDQLKNEIIQHVPNNITAHKRKMDSINILIDLRINKLTAAAIIILAFILFANFLENRDPGGDGIVKDSMVVVKHFFRSNDSNRLAELKSKAKFEALVRQGKDVVFYSESLETQDSNAILMQWKVSDNEYGIMFGDMTTKTVNAEELIKIQAQMLQKKKR